MFQHTLYEKEYKHLITYRTGPELLLFQVECYRPNIHSLILSKAGMVSLNCINLIQRFSLLAGGGATDQHTFDKHVVPLWLLQDHEKGTQEILCISYFAWYIIASVGVPAFKLGVPFM